MSERNVSARYPTIKMKSSLLAIAAISAFGAVSSQAATVIMTNDAGGLGASLDEKTTGTFAVPEIAGLSITIVSISSTGTGSGTLDLNSGSVNFGINSLGTTDDDADAFDTALSEIATFSFNQDVEITTIDFTTFTVGEAFNFGGQSITFSDNISTIYTFSTPLAIAANTSFSMQATTGTIGIESFEVTVVPEPSAALLGAIGALALLLLRRR